MDREIAPETRTRRKVRRLVTALIALAAVAFFFAATVEWLRPSLDRRDVQLARVSRGSIEATLQANGTVVPLFEQAVSSPVEARVLRIGRRAGARVKAGDELLTLDTGAARLETDRLAEQVAQKESETAQLRLRLDESIASIEAQIEQRRLDSEIFHYTATQKERLRAAGLIAEQDALAAGAAAKKSDIELRQLREQLARTKRSRDAQLAAAQADVAIRKREQGESQRQLELAMLRADRDGVLTYVVPEEGSTVRRGDVIARIADLSSYRVEATISDVHATRIAAGMRARVTLDEATLSGTIESVDPRIVNGVVKFQVTLDAPSDERLRHNMRVDVAVVTSTRRDTLVVRRGSLGRSNAAQAFVLRDDAVVRTPVKFGLSNQDAIEITEGLREGDQVVISNMTDLEDMNVVKLK
ncbi:MAG TPA: HlyD family efflux transporter periplasmic adaptor subunit [Thermoanaerobaculia bacterium]|nr:HlyD family efflux transporter periplasmic adaptor subunit [Thermoanaerobaculia bacterium]